MQIKVTDLNAPQKSGVWGYRILCLVLLALAVFSSYVALHTSKPICNDLRAVQINEYTRTLECVYDLGDKQEDEVDVLIR